MKFALCTISFRHQLISFFELVDFAKQHGFDGIELWGVHADRLYEQYGMGRADQALLQRRLAQAGLKLSMLSDYLELSSHEGFLQALQRCEHLMTIADWLGVDRIRTFAGRLGSKEISPSERAVYIHRLRQLGERCRLRGMKLLIEIHPGTLTDSLDSTLDLVCAMEEEQIGLNFDVLHAWEYGRDVSDTLSQLKPWVQYFHLKNVALPSQVHIFEPANVYSASGTREGMVLLKDGVVDYKSLMEQALEMDCYASIEWFGPSPLKVLGEEIRWLRQLQGQAQAVEV